MLTAMPTTLTRPAAGDAALVRRAAVGDEAACSLIFRRYHPRLELYCRSITRNDADAQDAAQSAMTKAFTALRRRPPESALRPWLFRIAHNEAISLMRRRRPEAEIGEEHPQAAHGPLETIELREEVRAVLDDVSRLAPRARQALLLRELAELDYAAVAGVLGISTGGARQAVFEARLALQDDRAGREAPCERVRLELSACEGRKRPTRSIRGHLRGCSSCRSWSLAQQQRRRALSLAPGLGLPLAAESAWAWLAGLFGGGSAVAGGVAVTPAVTGVGLGGAGAKLAAGMAAVAAGLAPVAAPHRTPSREADTAKRTTVASAAPQLVAVGDTGGGTAAAQPAASVSGRSVAATTAPAAAREVRSDGAEPSGGPGKRSDSAQAPGIIPRRSERTRAAEGRSADRPHSPGTQTDPVTRDAGREISTNRERQAGDGSRRTAERTATSEPTRSSGRRSSPRASSRETGSEVPAMDPVGSTGEATVPSEGTSPVAVVPEPSAAVVEPDG